MYDDFSADYDRFVDWPARLAAELPFIERELQAVGASRVLDAACGTGMHTIALAQRGYEVVGADLSAGMVERARANADAADIDVRFETAGFGELARTFAPGNFDALLCLGNSLPHLLTPESLAAALADFAACLRPDGLLLIQNRNFDAVMARGERWMEPQAYRERETEWLFLRFYDLQPNDKLTFNLMTLRREEAGTWEQHVTSTRLRPLRQAELTASLAEAGFDHVTCYGDMTGAPFDADRSPNLIVTARP
ncbi:MAG TPA: class I SAM-dependent methyltransferase [Chloroflexi bacterium]|nr:class I SAM-dependent methyltransferase [Chloroflexota bacterium]